MWNNSTRNGWLAVLFLLLSLSSSAVNCQQENHYYCYTKIHDISSPIRSGQTTWGSVDGLKGTFLNNTSKIMKLSTHMGTHVDSPGHAFQELLDTGHDAASLHLQTLNGPALLVDVPGNKNITGDDLNSLNLPKGLKRVLFRTHNTYRGLLQKKKFEYGYVGLEPDGAEWLIKNTEIKLIGMDYLSVAAINNTTEVHQILLKNGDVIPLEGLVLGNIAPGFYTLHCLPLKIPGADGAPTRCILLQ